MTEVSTEELRRHVERVHQCRAKLHELVAVHQDFQGQVDLIDRQLLLFDEASLGVKVIREEIPVDFLPEVDRWRDRLIETAAEIWG